MTQPPASSPQRPARSPRHGICGVISILFFQLVVVTFGTIVAMGSAGVAPSLIGKGMQPALHTGVLLTLPVALLGAILGLVDFLQLTRRRLFGMLGLALNAADVFLCLMILGKWL